MQSISTNTLFYSSPVFRASEMWDQLQRKAELYRTKVVLLPHGDDFRYFEAKEWEAQFTNLQKIMDYINNNPQMKMKVHETCLNKSKLLTT